MRYEPPADKKPVQKTKHLYKIPEKKKVWPCKGSVKYDGVYAYQINRPGDYRIFSATGMQYHSLKHLERIAEELDTPHHDDAVTIFEVWHPELPVNVISGYCRDEKEQHPELIAIVHDVIPYEDFINRECQISYEYRLAVLREHFNDELDQPYSSYFTVPDTFWIKDEAEAQAYFDFYTFDGEEGIIGRNPDGFWYGGHKKNADLWKKKIELSYDLLVIDMYEGEGKYKGLMGGLICRFRAFGKPDGEFLHVRCSGMTDKQRHDWWYDPELILEKIVKVDAMTYTKDGYLREPRFKEVREDINQPEF